MSGIFRGRYTARIEGPFVVFIIGVRINRMLAVHKRLPVARAMGPLVKQLLGHPGAWKRFNRAVGADGSVGIWHESFLVQADQYEASTARCQGNGETPPGQ